MKITMIAFVVLSMFALIGGIFCSVAFHEITHKIQFSNVPKSNEQLCLLAYPSNGDLGYYSFTTNMSDKQFNTVSQHAELGAYSVTIFVLLLVAFSFLIVFSKFYEQK